MKKKKKMKTMKAKNNDQRIGFFIIAFDKKCNQVGRQINCLPVHSAQESPKNAKRPHQ